MKRPTCGTDNGYRAHIRNKETTCAPCRKAIAAYMREYRYRTGRVTQRLTPITRESRG